MQNKTKPINHATDFVLSMNVHPSAIEELKSDLLKDEIPRLKLYRINLQEPFDDWRDLVVEWWNQFIDIGYTDKYPALYLFGSTNTGKTYFIRNFIMKDITENQFYSPTQSATDFAWISWCERLHVVGLVEEFKLAVLGQKNRERLKELIAGAGFFVPMKHRNETMFIKGRIPFIYTSNWSLEDANGIVDPAIASRFLQIDSNGKSYQRIITASEDAYRHMFKEEVFLIFRCFKTYRNIKLIFEIIKSLKIHTDSQQHGFWKIQAFIVIIPRSGIVNGMH
jgi:hypothetical protein